ncbi:radical SAM protein [Salinarimonas sp.]|uniref:radical SAM protein n=1 Tax=Salinarimonas sp. TaxID=2766526 RepID=UPI0032D99FD3
MRSSLPVTAVTMLTTNTCTAACAHCCMKSSPDRRGALTAEVMRSVVARLHEAGDLSTVIFAGGEPTMLKGALEEAIRFAAELGLNTRVVTNASWATTEERAFARLSRLRAAGLAELNISADDFHLPDVPFERVENAWRAAKRLDFRAVVIANCSGPDSLVTPDWIMERLGEELPLRFDDDGESAPLPDEPGTHFGVSNARLQRLREDVDVGAVHVELDEAALNRPCPFAGRSIAIGPDASLLACCGFEVAADSPLHFGDAAQTDVVDLLRRAYDDLLVNAVAELGPYFLMRFAQAKDPSLVFKPAYGGICEICFDVTSRREVLDVLDAHREELAGYLYRRVRTYSGAPDPSARETADTPS